MIWNSLWTWNAALSTVYFHCICWSLFIKFTRLLKCHLSIPKFYGSHCTCIYFCTYLTCIYFACLGVCLFVWQSVCIQKPLKLLNRLGQHFALDLTWPQGFQKVLILGKFWKSTKKIWNLRILLFVFVLYCTKRRCSLIEPQ